MLEKNNEDSKKVKKMDMFLDCTLYRLGFNCANLGTKYLKEILKLAYFNNMFDMKYKDFCIFASQSLNINQEKISSNIYHSINSININLTRKNFENIFHIEFDYFYISPKKLTILLLKLLDNTFI